MDMKKCIAEFTGTALLMYMTNYAPHNPMVWGVSFAVLTFMFGAHEPCRERGQDHQGS